jgi:hypothetical protein
LGSTGAHAARVKQMISGPRPNPANGNTVSGETHRDWIELLGLKTEEEVRTFIASILA